jgi:hypothetical protein
MSTQEDREHDERQEYGWANPLDPFARASEIIADQFAPVEYAEDVAPPEQDQGYTWDELVEEKSRDRAAEFLADL